MSKMPFAMQLLLAQMSGDAEAEYRVVDRCITEMTEKFLAVIHEYDQVDLPLVLATMQLTVQALMPTLGDNGRELVNNILSHTKTITFDLKEMRNQATENGEEEN